MTDERKAELAIYSRCRTLEREVKVQRRRTDKMREAVAAYLAGDISRKRLERVYHDTDYTPSLREDC